MYCEISYYKILYIFTHCVSDIKGYREEIKMVIHIQWLQEITFCKFCNSIDLIKWIKLQILIYNTIKSTIG